MDKNNFLKEEVRNEYLISIEMKKTWAVQIEMLEEVKRICEKYNITYFADSGTLLGAIRHSGFIPWDDDIDLGMTRDMYEKFLEVAPKELDERFFLQCNKTEIKKFFRVHAQIRYNNSTMLIRNDYGQKYNRGIFIDIFVYDKIPFEEKMDLKLRKKLFVRKKIIECYLSKNFNTPIFKYIVKKMVGIIGIIFLGGLSRAKNKYDAICAYYNDLNENYYYDLVGYNTKTKKCVMTKDVFEEKPILHQFEYTFINIMPNYHKFLEEMYGSNYLVPTKAPTDHGGLYIDNNSKYTNYDSLDKNSFEKLFLN